MNKYLFKQNTKNLQEISGFRKQDTDTTTGNVFTAVLKQ